MSQPIVLGAPSLLWVSCEASSKSDVSEPHGVAELCDVAVHVEHMSHGLCPMSICLAPREGISRLLQYHGGATAWSSSSPHACCSAHPSSLRSWPMEPGRDRPRGRTVAQRGCLRLWRLGMRSDFSLLQAVHDRASHELCRVWVPVCASAELCGMSDRGGATVTNPTHVGANLGVISS